MLIERELQIRGGLLQIRNGQGGWPRKRNTPPHGSYPNGGARAKDHGLRVDRSRLQNTAAEALELRHRSAQMINQLRGEGVDFLYIEFKTALTFAKAALRAEGDSAKRKSNQTSARKAYDTIVDLSKRLRPSDEDMQKIEIKLKQLRSVLQDLGERL